MTMLHLKVIRPKHGLYDFEPFFFELFIPILEILIIILLIYFGLHFLIGFIIIVVSSFLTNDLVSDRYGNWIINYDVENDIYFNFSSIVIKKENQTDVIELDKSFKLKMKLRYYQNHKPPFKGASLQTGIGLLSVFQNEQLQTSYIFLVETRTQYLELKEMNKIWKDNNTSL